MPETTQSLTDMLKNFGSNFGLPKVDVDKLIEMHRKNIHAVGQASAAATEGVQAVTEKQREIIEAGLREVATMARDYKPMASGREVIEKQTEYVGRLFDMTVKNARDVAGLANKSTSEAIEILRGRLKDAVEEIRSSVSVGKQ